MALAPYNNEYRGNKAEIIGQFREVEHRSVFEYYARNTIDLQSFASDYPHRIFVGPESEDTRVARVVKTRAYVVVDEAMDGSPVVETWIIRGHKTH